MSAELPIVLTLEQAHHAAIKDVSRWRGHCIESFARLERGMTLTLQAFPTGECGKAATVFGERLKRLAAAVAQDGSHPHARIRKALADMDEQLERRNLMVHATGSIYVNRQGRWLWRYSCLPTKAGAEEQCGAITQAEGERIERDLATSVQSLCEQLRSCREELQKNEAVAE